MTEPIAPPSPPSARDWTTLALVGTVVTYAVLNALLLAIQPRVDDSYVVFAKLGMAIVQPILFGMWTALACGSVFKRLLIVVPSLIVPLTFPIYFAPDPDDMFRRDFIAIALATWTIFCVALFLFLTFRLLRFRIRHKSLQTGDVAPGFQFGIKHLLALMTVYGAAMGLVAGLTFRPEPTSTPNFFGPSFVFVIAFFGGGYFSAAALPTAAVPLSILHGRPSRKLIYVGIALWAFVTTALFLLFIDQEGAWTLAILLLVQLGALTTGALTAFTLRRAGLRLTRLPRRETPLP